MHRTIDIFSRTMPLYDWKIKGFFKKKGFKKTSEKCKFSKKRPSRKTKEQKNS